MLILNKSNTPRAEIPGLKTWLLVSQTTTQNRRVSTSLTELDVQGIQPLHAHAPEQCYFIIAGQGLMTLGPEQHTLYAGHSVFIPSNLPHGIENTGTGKLIYLTASSPVFDLAYEQALWSLPPADVALEPCHGQ